MRVLFVSSEIFPYAKTGGLGDVSGALPKALTEAGVETISVMPLYGSVDTQAHGIEYTGKQLAVQVHHHHVTFDLYRKDSVYFLSNTALFDREVPYGDYADNDLRFGLFAYGVMALMDELDQSDAIHINDWQTGLVAFLAKERYGFKGRVVLTIHNLAFQGVFDKKTVDALDIGWENFTMHRFEFFDKVNFLKGAIAYSDAIVAASPRYAREITTPAYGCRLDPFLRENTHKLTGILNGIDTKEFNPRSDARLYARYTSPVSRKKRENKEKFLTSAGLENPNAPLLVFIGRFAWQKGIDSIYEAVSFLNELPMNIAILGEGEKHYNDAFESLGSAYPNLFVRVGYDETLARRMYAAADMLLMPSEYEPCGLNQMIAMNYGVLPLVSDTGGLADTVCDLHNKEQATTTQGVGVRLAGTDPFSLLHGVAKALALFGDTNMWQEVLKSNQRIDRSWAAAARSYQTLYIHSKE